MKTGRIEYQKVLKIPSDSTCIFLCGVQNSGKTTFAKKWFDHKTIVSSDEHLESIIEISGVNDLNYEYILNHSIENFLESLAMKSFNDNFLVIDTMCISENYRNVLLDFVSEFFNNIILIIFDVSLETVLSRPLKSIDTPFLKTPIENVPNLINDLHSQMESKKIVNGFDVVYVINDTTVDSEVLLV